MSSLSSLLVPGCRVGVVGSRDFSSPSLVESFVVSLPEGSVVVSGAGGVVDLAAAEAGRFAGLEVLEFPAEWSRFGRGAGMLRNRKIVSAGLDVLVVFLSDPGCPSRGSASSMRLARAAGIPVFVFGPDGESEGGGKKALIEQLKLF